MLATLNPIPSVYRHGGARTWLMAMLMLSLPWWPGRAAAANDLEPVPGTPAARALGIADLGGRVHRLGDYDGRVVLVNFWATWCPPCVAEMPGLQRLYTALSDEPFALLGISMGEGERRIRHFGNTHSIEFPLLLDRSSELSRRWGVDFLPTSYLIDARGRLRYKAHGEVDWDAAAVRATIHDLLDEARPAQRPPD